MEGAEDNYETSEEFTESSWPPRRPAQIQTRQYIPYQNGHGSTNGFVHASLTDLSVARVLHGQSRALSTISLRAFLLGISLGTNILLVVLFLFNHLLLWRAPFFLATLSLFHFLEFYITAKYNTRFADVAAFLLSQNGVAYQVAHSAAFSECIISSLGFPKWQQRVSNPWTIALGCSAIIIGQFTRSWAMVHAGTNFNHTVQTHKAQGHELVTTGIYAWLRHPSYFGFFWWALGTQLVLGNVICLPTYAAILWKFFNSRIQKEEEFLVNFFEEDYPKYRDQTPVRIPFIR